MMMRVRSCFLARSADPKIRLGSASGAVFAELARWTISRRGIVFGAAWDAVSQSVRHLSVEDPVGLLRLTGSKYAPSEMADVYAGIERALSGNRLVLFSGTPCQCAAVKRRFGEKGNLLICALFCHSVPDSEIWCAYVGELERRAGSRLVDVRFTDKRLGWPKRSFVAIFEDAEKNFTQCVDENPYMRAFFAGYSSRPSCLQCQFKGDRSGADLLIGDCWGASILVPEWCDGQGVSAVVTLSESGEKAIRSAALQLKDAPLESVLRGNPYLLKSVQPDFWERSRFLRSYREIGFDRAFLFARDGVWPRRLLVGVVRWVRRVVSWLYRQWRRAP